MTDYKRPTHEEGIAKAQEIAERHGIAFNELRWFAADHLSQDLREWLGEDHGHGISSGDVSCHLSSLGNFDAYLLEAHAAKIAKRDALVARVAASTGRSTEDTLSGLRALFAPVEP